MRIDSNIYYRLSKHGDGIQLPVVLIHGAGSDHLFWPPEIRRMKGFQVYALDLPGHGRAKGHGLQDIKTYAEIISNWMNSIKLNRAVIIGHSMGGAIALTLTREYEEKVLGLGLISTGARLRVNPLILENTRYSQTYPTALSFIISKSFSKDASPKLISLAQRRMADIRPSVLHGDLLACDKFDLTGSLQQIRTPCLIVCGQDDEMTPPRYSQHLSENIKGANLNLVPGAGHMVMLEKPQIVMDIMERFLNQIPFHPWQS